MPRPQRKEINFTKDSILGLMQEIYNELVEQRNTALRIQNKMISMMKDPSDMQSIGPVIEKQQKIINHFIENAGSIIQRSCATLLGMQNGNGIVLSFSSRRKPPQHCGHLHQLRGSNCLVAGQNATGGQTISFR